MKVHQATLEDLHALTELFELYRAFYKQEANFDGAQQFLKERLTNEDSVVFIAYDEGKALGFTQLYPAFSSLSMERIWILNDLYVKKEARNKGTAQKLIDQAVHLVEETDAKGILLETNQENTPAQKLYDKLGFKKEANQFYFLSLEHYEKNIEE
ncbi:GNAT family N-acetyltransferase [Pseudogracilibacillus auburnensis]|uniref:Acetyltransferase (GNAT) family protein n=1 Tax=Pseudogracilibacillus auburnensis TaxID=1494959 RepID=A0A2V3WCP4_9BACI|nr:GNAT family N-acetyltransferase [Pseudogracilibacillus auburnensis]PXW86549.1 acetyltransferase (GNAT) family protein [Pseudogracilibacillus auburnensis]